MKDSERNIEVIGGYDEDFGNPPTRRPLPADTIPVVRELKDCEDIRRYLISLTNRSMLKNYRHIQYRNLEDGSLNDFYGYGSFNVKWGGPIPIEAGQVVDLPTAAKGNSDAGEVACCAGLSEAVRAGSYSLLEVGAGGGLTITVGWNPNDEGGVAGFEWIVRAVSFCPFCGKTVRDGIE